MYQVGDTRLFFTRCDQPQRGPYAKEEVGLNHFAFGVRTLEDLEVIEAQLNRAGIPNSGIKKDRYGQREFIWLDDPDNMRVEFYLRPDDR
jgi:glyoxylase I family protein